MDAQQVARYSERLEAILAELETDAALGNEGTRTVELDQQSVGRLSRMDALQQQAMAKAQQGRRAGAERRIKAALARIENGEFGYCTECGEGIGARRLDLDPTAPTCINCAR
ncbi:transcriptional regulator, TraR/DksA family [Rhodovulum sp. ES.010]|uniref:TraR/DksA family transcriptional regulator n=1 Tax=Rhodovulum sp. ES.010 TaxID=1882821 RepID=UPI000929375D|nr:TraR/DksA C4-type zinc finger protein [Rhodovulum sp. ES.010]SIO11172.1 transcriptional regulator, TraR/DksA family [Rhodovulum sp. ES.010]